LENDQPDILFKDLSYDVMSAVFEVHNILGPGFKESLYENALCYELTLRGTPFKNQHPIEVRYKGLTVGTHVLDVLVNDEIILELKAVSALDEIHEAQLLSYLKSTGLSLGILINFGQARVVYKRMVHTLQKKVSEQ